MLAVVHSAVLTGATGRPVRVEVHIDGRMPGFAIVGLPDAAVRESRDRVRAALSSSGLPWPQRHVTVNLAPSGVRKAGAGLDLAIAVGVLAATERVPADALDGTAFIAELGLDGSLRHVPGMMALAEALGPNRLVVAEPDAVEAALAGADEAVGIASLDTVVASLCGRVAWPPAAIAPRSPACSPGPDGGERGRRGPYGDLSDVRGQRVGRRAVEVAAAGGHHLLLVGPPGSGKTMLARRIPGLLPQLAHDQALQVTRLHSAAGYPIPDGRLLWDPPLRAPHHGASSVAMIGGGTSSMRPGEISLATHGVLFLDEMGEFAPAVLDGLREPLEDGVVRVSRARATVEFPARFILVAAMNPCPCGEGGPIGACRCTAAARARYVRRLSGPLLDRFDLVVALQRPGPAELLSSAPPAEPSVAVARRVARARQRAAARGVACNAELCGPRLDDVAPLTPQAEHLLARHLAAGSLSARGLDRVRRVARTVADLAGDGGDIEEHHVAEVLALRAGRDVLEAAG